MNKLGLCHNLRFGVVNDKQFVFVEDLKKEVLPFLDDLKMYYILNPNNELITFKLNKLEKLIKELE